ncbi:MAG: hypothetical protein NZ903_02925 [Candidatus Micrarchaeota archaeon]|nr:hypothetical protein [Candidatus Micrarchaeota archaeon]
MGEINGEKLRRHNSYIIEQIKNTREYAVYCRIKVLHEELMKRANSERKKEIFERQFNLARKIFNEKIGIYNNGWRKIGDE